MDIGVDIIAKVKYVKKPFLFFKQLLMKKKLTREVLDEFDKTNPTLKETKNELFKKWIENYDLDN